MAQPDMMVIAQKIVLRYRQEQEERKRLKNSEKSSNRADRLAVNEGATVTHQRTAAWIHEVKTNQRKTNANK